MIDSGNMSKAIDQKYIYSDLSHDIIGSAYDVQNMAGVGCREKTYQQLMAVEFVKRGYKFKEQVKAIINPDAINEIVRRFDFVVEDKVVVELKVGPHLGRADYEQMKEYLNISGYKLGLLILFSYRGVVSKRLPNVL